ncbi:unnamed protein product [Bursaphelenchus xylophilus]|uniref:(pine wood nematode) hypothetical protein n=1 Tax=Bursaphelenchus xylophilus TaxID=6326 RepID=A0A1I7S1B3_BURXY|nr:unnamed protein product [Bursaphelenchus xylophilus]CAG9080230.1 unnamed protein product [Bursaphelenchus xylophilus]
MKNACIVLLVAVLVFSEACDIIIKVKSQTDKKFKAQVTSPNGKKSDKWSFTKNRQQERFQEKASECGLGEFVLQVYDEAGKEAQSAKVTLNGIGSVLYHVGDDLKPTQVERQGAICNGQCAPLAQPVDHSKSRPNSPVNTPSA